MIHSQRHTDKRYHDILKTFQIVGMLGKIGGSRASPTTGSKEKYGPVKGKPLPLRILDFNPKTVKHSVDLAKDCRRHE